MNTQGTWTLDGSRAAGVWYEVRDRAGGRCECAGECGSPHRKGGGRCHVEDHWPDWCDLTVTPADAGESIETAARLPCVALRLRCSGCWRALRHAASARARESAQAAQPALFEGRAA